ncbi:MAG: hypothetical protein OQK96_05370, partial [Gammaproteobacteria bacterium]|nr:hypothetical protein [Gammaproteobacteria bacterium]
RKGVLDAGRHLTPAQDLLDGQSWMKTTFTDNTPPKTVHTTHLAIKPLRPLRLCAFALRGFL